MRIALVYHALRQDAGVPKMHTQLARFLVAREHDVHLFGSLDDSDPSLVPGARFHDVGVATRPTRLGKPVSSLRFMRRAARLVRETRPDVVHARALGAWHADIVHVTGLYWDEFGGGIRVAAGGRERERELRLLRLLARPVGLVRLAHERRLAETGAGPLLHAETSAVRDGLISRYGVPGDRIRVVVPAVDVHAFSPEGPRAALDLPGPLIAFCGHDFRRKGLDRVIRALALLRTPASLVVIGGGANDRSAWGDAQTAAFKRLAGELGVLGRVRFVGAQDDAAPYLRAADVLAHPARFDVWGLAVVEAMAAGLPVAVTTSTGASELVDDTNGTVLPADASPGALAASLDELLAPDRRASAGARAHETALGVSVERQGALVEEDLEAVARRRRGG